MKIRYTLIIALFAAVTGYTVGNAAGHTAQPLETACIADNGCIDFDAHPELIGGGLELEPTSGMEQP